MSASDVFLLAVRWLHLMSAALWVGGGLFYLLVFRPALRRAPEAPESFTAATATEFRALVNMCIVVLVATGAILAFDRLTSGHVDAPYVVTLGVKVTLTVWMFLLVWSQRRNSRLREAYRHRPEAAQPGFRGLGRAVSGYNTVFILGVGVFLLSDLLKVLFEIALRD
jgi:uncharacterized membrane protein